MADDQPTENVAANQPASADMAAYERAWRAKRKAAGLCTSCGAARDTPGRVRCAACLGADKASYERIGRDHYRQRAERESTDARAERARWNAQGLCTWCGGPRDIPARKRCSDCKETTKAANTARYRKRRDAGLCPDCGEIPTAGVYCDRCNDIRREDYRAAYAEDPIRFRLRCDKRRRRIEANGGTYTTEDWEDVKARQDYRCLRCGRAEPEIRLTVDHVIPVSKGGTSDPTNLAGPCSHCNKVKGARHIDYRTPPGP